MVIGMLISRVSEDGGANEGKKVDIEEDHSHEYQTANELFELMAKNHRFNANDELLTPSDLVILYKNIDLGTRLISDANVLKRPNRRVETVVYTEDHDSDASEFSEIYSNEDLHDVSFTNQEQTDLLHSPSLENVLCHKLGDFDMQTSDLAPDYDKHFIFKDPFIQEQLKTYKLISASHAIKDTILPSSLLDYVCCKQMEDNYNIYMENIIKYVMHIIEQLKRISNGDYLTDKAKLKWREVYRNPDDDLAKNEKVLATCTSIPLHVQQKVTGYTPLWDDIVHSEIDIRSLAKILEKKIVLEIPKIINGSYRLFSKFCADNLVISCKREGMSTTNEEKKKKSRVDVMFRLKRSDSGHVVSNINSIMVIEKPCILYESSLPEVLTPQVTIDEVNLDKNKETLHIMELNNLEEGNNLNCTDEFHECGEFCNDCENEYDENKEDNECVEPQSEHGESNKESIEEHNDCSDISTLSPNFQLVTSSDSNIETNDRHVSGNTTTGSQCNGKHESHLVLKDILDTAVTINKESSFNITPDELRLTMQSLNIQSSLPEETGEDIQNHSVKKKSPTRIRLKSPYENQSFLMEEKKRKRLLEIREKREKKKMALSESCKIMKHRYTKGGMPQTSSSVTKLSITNKSFYNSIYGQAINDDRPHRLKIKRGKKEESLVDITRSTLDGDVDDVPSTPETNSKKYINRSYYLDEAVTEVMQMPMKADENAKDLCSTSTSSALVTDLNFHDSTSHLITPSVLLDLHCKGGSLDCTIQCDTIERSKIINDNPRNHKNFNSVAQNNTVPENTPRGGEFKESALYLKKLASTIACRNSINKIYDLMKKVASPEEPETHLLNIKEDTNVDRMDTITNGQGSSTVQGSDSGTSLKHHLTPSDASEFSFEKPNKPVLTNYLTNKMAEIPSAVVPKVIISTKSQSQKTDVENNKKGKDRKRVAFNGLKDVPENPLKAISHLLHEFESVQKSRHKDSEAKLNKKTEAITNDTRSSRQGSCKRKSRLDQHQPEKGLISARTITIASRDKKTSAPIEGQKIPLQQVAAVEKNLDKSKNKISDIIDEAKEARGEAVRGPSKNSRLNTLAQPKRSYVQAHSQEYRSKYGRNLLSDRLHRLAGTQSPQPEKTNHFNSRNKPKAVSSQAVFSPTVKQPSLLTPSSPTEIAAKLRRISNSSPEKNKPPADEPVNKTNLVGTREVLKNKMVAVESYVKLHYGQVKPEVAPEDIHTQKSRVPFVPNDIELVSLTSSPLADESSALGSKLHNIIDIMINSNSPVLSALLECQESSKHINDLGSGNISKSEDVNNTIDHEVLQNTEQKEEQTSTFVVNDALQTFNSATELQRLESALHRRMSVSNIQKRLRLKNLTLTPKQSLCQVMVLQAGDANSLILKPSLSQNLKIKSESTTLPDITLPVLTNPQFGWSYTKIPMHIATVGYTLPTYEQYAHALKKNSKLSIPSQQQTIKDDHSSCLSNPTSDKTSQCFKGQQLKLNLNMNDANNFGQASESTMPPVIKETPETADIERVDKCNYVENSNENHEAMNDSIVSEKTANIEYTASLDMLATLLNEIQRITCQSQIANPSDNEQCKQFQHMLNTAVALENVESSAPRELVSITSLDKLRQLDSSPSIYSLYLSGGEDRQTNITPDITRSISLNAKPICCDKEVSADISEKRYTNKITNVPSQLFPISITHSANVTKSLIGVLSETSNRTIHSFKDYQTFSSISLLNSKKKIVGSMCKETESNSSIQSSITYKIDNTLRNDEKLINSSKDLEKNIETEKNFECVKQKTSTPFKEVDYYLKATELDPLMKMKRDILVTVYSVLVLTVFAALSFPELLYRA